MIKLELHLLWLKLKKAWYQFQRLPGVKHTFAAFDTAKTVLSMIRRVMIIVENEKIPVDVAVKRVQDQITKEMEAEYQKLLGQNKKAGETLEALNLEGNRLQMIYDSLHHQRN